MRESGSRAPTESGKAVHMHPLWALASILLLFFATLFAFRQAPYPNPLEPLAERGLLDLFRFPIEVNGAMRLDAAPSRLRAITASADGQVLWAAGEGGAILVSTNGGARWQSRPSGVHSSLRGVHMHQDGRRGWITGEQGVILATTDGGQSWRRQSSPVQATLNDIWFDAEGTRGVAVGDDGLILTNNGGLAWKQVAGTEDRSLSDIYFLPNTNRGWAVGVRGLILETGDGGATWVERSSPVEGSLWSVHVSRDDQGWAVGPGGTMLRTRNGGADWVEQPRQTDEDLRDVGFLPDGRFGWITGDAGLLLFTSDGGETWQARSGGIRIDFTAGHFVNEQDGWVVGRGTVLRTHDGGRSWTAQLGATPMTLYSVQFMADNKRGWATGAAGLVLSTVDGGENWRAARVRVAADLHDIQMLPDGMRGWAVGDRGAIASTGDGGRSWTVQENPSRSELGAVHFLADGARGWAVGDAVLATADGGRTWEVRKSPFNEFGDWSDVLFTPDGRRGWIVGSGGAIHATIDGGQTWTRQQTPVDVILQSVHFLDDGLRGWVVGDEGTVLATADGGTSWVNQPSPLKADFVSVSFSADGLRGWAGGTGGAVIRTTDGGKTWLESDTTVGTVRLALWFDAAGTRGWAVGYPPALLSIQPGQDKWRAQAWPLRYARYPAPWFWCALVAAGLMWRHALRSKDAPVEAGAAAMAASDAPAQEFSRDTLQFGPLAKGISRFLRNESTEAPLTIAISGEWGVGKSTLMHLVCKDLQRHGNKPVWFNAWHHQKDEHLLAGLLTAIKNQGLPSSWTPDGWVFRLRLAYIRSKKHFFLTFVAVLLLAATTAYLQAHGWSEWIVLWEKTRALLLALTAATEGAPPTLPSPDVGKILAQLITVLGTLVILRNTLTAFGANPAVLLATTAEQFRLKDATALTNFRMRFAAQFSEVTQALPYRLTIVIDDLDRCRAESVLDVMEAVNFVVSSGPCFVMFGMATHRVRAALAHSFEKIAPEMDGADDSGPQAGTPAASARTIRHDYARDYMEKLINLEIVVPVEHAVAPHALFERSDRSSGIASSWRPYARFWPLALCACAMIAGWQFGWHVPPPAPGPHPVSTVAAPVPAAHPGLAPARADPGPVPSTPQARVRYVPEVQPGERGAMSWPAIAVPLALFAAAATAFAVYRLRTTLYQVQDSDAFKEALRAWAPLVQQKRRTPRSLKRFGNRIRYLAMLQQAERLDQSLWDNLYRKLRFFPRGAQAGPAGDGEPRLVEEHRVVALGALYEVFGADWRECAKGRFPDNDLGRAAKAALGRYMASGRPAAWPPSEYELDRFALALRGVRVPSS